VSVDGWVIRPRDFDPGKKYPIVVYVYGDPAGVTAANTWSGIRTLFHGALAPESYVVASFNNSGTPWLKGRAWPKSIYRNNLSIAYRKLKSACKWPLLVCYARAPWLRLEIAPGTRNVQCEYRLITQ
jgi:dipeptidyl-peptidase 4